MLSSFANRFTFPVKRGTGNYHLPKHSGNFGSNVNGKIISVCPNEKKIQNKQNVLKCSPKFPTGISICFNLPVPGLSPVSTRIRGCSAQFQALRVNSGKWNTPNLIRNFRSGHCLPLLQTVNQSVSPYKC